MLLKLFLLAAFAGLAYAACPDSNDKEIRGFCFKFVVQKMAYNDARNWCHYQNPVGPSYLAVVGNKETNNNLAVYARSAFGASAEYFWIGLSRNGSSGALTWDNGFPVIYTNFGSHVGNNYFTEKISNSKWDTPGDSEKNYFVCSYDPTVQPVTPKATTPTTTTAANVNCPLGGQQTVLFAYSNDLVPSVVLNTFSSSYLNSQPVTIAISRFDTRQPQSMMYFNDYNQAYSYLSTNLPDSTLGFGDSTAGSNVLDVINNFYSSPSACGSVVMVLAKRYPNTTDISNTVAKVRQYHGIVNFLASNTPSGGTQSRVLFDLASKTNGIYSIDDDSTFSHFIGWMPLRERYPIYAVNPKVSGQGSQTLSPMSVPRYAQYLMMVTVQSHVPVSNVQSATLGWHNQSSSYSGIFGMQPAGWEYINSNDDGTRENIDANVFNMTIDYVYTNTDVETMQIRFYSPYATTYWLPYSD
ncbi:C-type lectin domain-containing protein [Caenorhabditis elegans]|uniref:C-type lectin domain-containing protein n=1 Tax=Caenorhabditis elegans TaxID=6239 RepID=Q8ITX4_CAEEL|nr:C-type lectin domain-containing protein [Caenorhabditis elegans]CCD70720.1 C-type lectin domain-containing protein [Caenorhabditis elegans]|eukprot:NP_500437.2 C-type LECtin [Caenorhabditis elegans]